MPPRFDNVLLCENFHNVTTLVILGEARSTVIYYITGIVPGAGIDWGFM